MAHPLTVEERLAILEKEITDLKDGMAQAYLKPNWIDRVKGSFRSDPEFGETAFAWHRSGSDWMRSESA